MSNGNAASWWSRPLNRFATFLLFGMFAGATWLAGMMPVGVTGAVGYDLSRFAFAATVLVALLCLFTRPWREYGLGVFFLGMLLGIYTSAQVFSGSFRPGTPTRAVVFLFGVSLGVTAALTLAFVVAHRQEGKDHGKGERSNPTAAPRRFGMGTLLIVVLVVCVIFAGAKRLAIPPILSLWTGSFLSIIGGLQMVMNKVPRAVSVGTGAVLLPVTVAVQWTASGAGSRPLLAMLVAAPSNLAFTGAHVVVLGAVLGYVGGVLVAGLFLVIELTDRRLRGQKSKAASA